MGQCSTLCFEFLKPVRKALVKSLSSTATPPQALVLAEQGEEGLTLDDIARKHRTDKSSRYHNYAQFYDRIFSRIRGSRIKLLEVGIGTVVSEAPSSMNSYVKKYKPGASLRMWAEYFPNASLIAGIDTQADRMFREGSINTALADSRCSTSVSEAMAKLNCETFDIILDDGLHEQPAQIDTLRSLLNYLSAEGVYIIEDIRRPFLLLPKIKEILPNHRFHVETLAKLNPKKRLPDTNIILVLPPDLEQAQKGTGANSVKESLVIDEGYGTR